MIILFTVNDNAPDESQFAAFYEKYKNKVMRYSLSFVADRYDAEEVAQETWLTLWQRFDDFPPGDEEAIKAFMLVIIRNKSIDVLRRRETRKAVIADVKLDDADYLLGTNDTTLFEVCKNETAETVSECLDSLDEKYRSVLILFYFSDKSVKEISSLLKISKQNVWKRLERGRNLLANAIKKKGGIIL